MSNPTCITDEGPRTPWAYTGTDSTPGVAQYPLTPCNSVPMMVVWLTLTASEALQNPDAGLDDEQLQDLADSIGLTKKSVIAIRDLIKQNEDVSNAFQLVAQTFLTIGRTLTPKGNYNPSACPTIDQIKLFASAAIAIVPQPDTFVEKKLDEASSSRSDRSREHGKVAHHD